VRLLWWKKTTSSINWKLIQTINSRGTQNILNAIEKGSNQKLILVTGIGAGDSKGHGGFFYDLILNPLLLAANYADKDRAESIVIVADGDGDISGSKPHTSRYRGNRTELQRSSRSQMADRKELPSELEWT
jgi:hypothetical protein